MNPIFLHNFTTTNGRTTRASYWLSTLCLFLLFLCLTTLNISSKPLILAEAALIIHLTP